MFSFAISRVLDEAVRREVVFGYSEGCFGEHVCFFRGNFRGVPFPLFDYLDPMFVFFVARWDGERAGVKRVI